ncbi:hypothetical protein Tco_0543909 [Tanacetum coccineum]
MLLGINLLLLGKVNAARHKLTTIGEVNAARYKLTAAGENQLSKRDGDNSLVMAATTTDLAIEAEQDRGVNTPRSDDDRLKLNEVMEFFTKLQQRVLDLENTKTAQAQEITSLKLRVKKLEKKDGEDASKQGRKINDIDKDTEITLVHETQGRYGDEEMFDTGVLDTLKSAKVLEKANVVEEPSESITKTPTLTKTTAATTIIVVSTRPKAKGLVIHEEEQATTPTVSSQQPSLAKEQDKGKGIMIEEPMKMKKKDQISLDEELAFKQQLREKKRRHCQIKML